MLAAHAAVDHLAAMKGIFGRDAARRTVALLERLSRVRFRDAAKLIRFHDLVLYLRAFPQSPRVVRLADKILFPIHETVPRLHPHPFDDPYVPRIPATPI